MDSTLRLSSASWPPIMANREKSFLEHGDTKKLGLACEVIRSQVLSKPYFFYWTCSALSLPVTDTLRTERALGFSTAVQTKAGPTTCWPFHVLNACKPSFPELLHSGPLHLGLCRRVLGNCPGVLRGARPSLSYAVT